MLSLDLLVQSQGTGKTRLVLRLTKRRMSLDNVGMRVLDMAPVNDAMYVFGRALPKGLYEMLTEHEEYATLEVRLSMVLDHALEHWSQKTWTTRMHKTVDWVIPVVQDQPNGNVLMQLVRVERHLDENEELNDDEDETMARQRIQNAVQRLRPSVLWSREPSNPLGQLNAADVLRVYVDLRDARCADDVLPYAQCFVGDLESAAEDDTSFGLCLCGRSWWRGHWLVYPEFEDDRCEKRGELEALSIPQRHHVTFISFSVAYELRLLLASATGVSDVMVCVASTCKSWLPSVISDNQISQTIETARLSALFEGEEFDGMEPSTVTDPSIGE